MSKSLKMIYITVNNTHIAKLINMIKAMINKQKQQIAAFIRINTYIAALKFEAATAAAGLPPIHEIPTCFVREIVIRCLNTTPEDHIQLIFQLVKKINKK